MLYDILQNISTNGIQFEINPGIRSSLFLLLASWLSFEAF